MPSVEIKGGLVEYELLGPDDGKPIVLTYGGRFGKDHPGARKLAEALAAGGLQVLIWDRPNCGRSDVRFQGQSESHMRAETLGALVKALDLAPIVFAGGSGGSRDSALTAALYPGLVDKLVLWHIVGGVYGPMSLASYYVLPSILAVRQGGMQAVLALPEWAELIEANPRNKQRFLDLGAEELLTVMLRWLNAFVPKPGQTFPGVDDWLIEQISAPTLVIRSGEGDLDHPRRTSYDVHTLIKGSKFVEPPWAEDAWERAMDRAARGEGTVLDPWVEAAPVILDFVAES
ncbi:alpha/beta hydrolase [Amycolatopsis sp. K13G38]|uniref:Alpha/beta hydrolase n=1 Tax=Amycolatopsis acididurans TaxID=2724524 RepID=A0ABX1IW92_9PSEU|nr:alpha/beta hydrolase [Amycolatopsis acididurans]NKQ51584.1 alpha/beta hydrolase [Amycolatopsis acididurans]